MIGKRWRRAARAAGLVFCLALAPCAAETPQTPAALVLSDSDGTRLFSAAVRPGERFSIVFTHSHALSRIEEIFSVLPGGRFRLVETHYEDFGAGLPHEEKPGQTMRFRDGEIALDGYTAEFGELWLRVGHIAEHRIITPAREQVYLKDYARPGAAVRIAIQEEGEGTERDE